MVHGKDCGYENKKGMHHSGLSWETGAGCRIEPEAPAWQAEILPLNQWCCGEREKTAVSYPRIRIIASRTLFTVLLVSNISAYSIVLLCARLHHFHLTSYILHLTIYILHLTSSIAALTCRQPASCSRCEAVKQIQSESNSLHKLCSVTSK